MDRNELFFAAVTADPHGWMNRPSYRFSHAGRKRSRVDAFKSGLSLRTTAEEFHIAVIYRGDLLDVLTSFYQDNPFWTEKMKTELAANIGCTSYSGRFFSVDQLEAWVEAKKNGRRDACRLGVPE